MDPNRSAAHAVPVPQPASSATAAVTAIPVQVVSSGQPQPRPSRPVQPSVQSAPPAAVPTTAPSVAQVAAAAPAASPAAAPVPTPAQNGRIIQLPISVVTKIDVGRLLREVQAIDNFLKQSAIRQPGTALKLPRTSKLMDDLLAYNQINALVEDDRNRLIHFLMEVYSRAPVLHMSFSADPTPYFVQRLMTWLRREIHPIVLIQIGMQPNMGAGCVVRTTNKYFDFSLRHRFNERREILAQRLTSGVA